MWIHACTVCVNVHMSMHVFSKRIHTHCMHSQSTSNSCRDWLWLRLDRQDRRKLMAESNAAHSPTFLSCCAVAKLEDTLDQSSAVGYKSKAIQ